MNAYDYIPGNLNAQAFKLPGRVGGSASLCLLPGWAKQTTEFMTSQLPGTKCYVPIQSAVGHAHRRPGVHQSVNQSSKRNVKSALCHSQVNQMLHCTETTHHQRIACHKCLQ